MKIQSCVLALLLLQASNSGACGPAPSPAYSASQPAAKGGEK